MNKFLQDIPGFRTNRIWKKVFASLFYVLFFFAILGSGFEGLFLLGGLGLLGFSIYEFISNKRNSKGIKVPIIMLVIAIILLSTGSSIFPDSQAIAEGNAQIETLTKENQELKSLNEELESKYESFENEKEILESEARILKEDNEKLKDEINKLEEEVNELKEQIESLNESVKNLEAKKEQEKKEQEQKVASSNQSSPKSTAPASSSSSNQSSAKTSSSTNNSIKSSGGGGSSTGAATQTGQGEVYVTPKGSKYHKGACGKGNYTATTLEKAKARGLTPCKKCY